LKIVSLVAFKGDYAVGEWMKSDRDRKHQKTVL
jgi:hypothetical protein